MHAKRCIDLVGIAETKAPLLLLMIDAQLHPGVVAVCSCYSPITFTSTRFGRRPSNSP